MKHKEAPERLGKHLEVLGSTGMHHEALGSPLEVMGSTRKHLQYLEGREALRSTRKHQEALGSARKHLEVLGSRGWSPKFETTNVQFYDHF